MTDQRDRERVQHAIDACFSSLKGDPWLAQRIITGAGRAPKPQRKLSLGVVLAIALALATMAVAIAAQQLGWVDFFGSNYGVAVPKAAQQAMDAARPQAYQVGPMTFTFNQLLTDPHIALSAAGVRTTDGSEALYASDTDVYDAVGARGDTLLAKYGLDPDVNWLDAALQLGLPLFGVRALIEIGAQEDGGAAMEDAMWQEDGSIVYFNMPMLASPSVKDELPVTLYMAVTQFDPATGEPIEKWQRREAAALSVAPLLAERTYWPEGGAMLGDIAVRSVHAEQYATGVYLTATFTLPAGLSADEARVALYRLSLCDAEGGMLPMGLNLSGAALLDDQPTAALENLTSLAALPGRLIVSDGAAEVTVRCPAAGSAVTAGPAMGRAAPHPFKPGNISAKCWPRRSASHARPQQMTEEKTICARDLSRWACCCACCSPPRRWRRPRANPCCCWVWRRSRGPGCRPSGRRTPRSASGIAITTPLTTGRRSYWRSARTCFGSNRAIAISPR